MSRLCEWAVSPGRGVGWTGLQGGTYRYLGFYRDDALWSTQSNDKLRP